MMGKASTHLRTRGQKNVTAIGSWQKGLDHFELIYVIQNQQPIAMRLLPAFDGLDNGLLIWLIFLWKIQILSEAGIASDQCFLHPLGAYRF